MNFTSGFQAGEDFPQEKVSAIEQHINVAQQMAKEIILNYDPVQQNECSR